VPHTLDPDIARVAGEAFGNRVLALGMLRAIHTASRQKARKIRNPDAEHLLGQDVINALLKTRHIDRQSRGETAGDLALKHAGLSARVKKPQGLVRPDVCPAVVSRPGVGQRVQHPVGKLRRRKDFVIREISDAGQNIRISASQRKASLGAHAGTSVASTMLIPANSHADTGG